MSGRHDLPKVIERLNRAYGSPFLPPTTDPFGLILWEQVAYLASDDKRTTTFDRLRREVGLTPADILGAPHAQLVAIAREGGGTAAADRAERMRRSAEMVVDTWDGDLGAVRTIPLAGARKALQRFPMIGAPGADKILVLSGAHAVLALDSNGLRVLLRLGYGSEQSSYAATYKSVCAAAWPECEEDMAWLARAHGLLRMHGQACCRQRSPACVGCAVEEWCPASEAGRTM